MRKNIMKVFALLVAVMVLVSCKPTPKSYLENFTEFVEDVEQNASSYTDEMWAQKDAEFNMFTNEKYDEVAQEITSDDKEAVGELVVRYYKAKGIAIGQNWLDLIEGWCKSVKGGIEGLFGHDFLKNHGLDIDGFNISGFWEHIVGDENSNK